MDPSHRLQAALPQLSMFVAVARHRSFSAAARELGISVSAVSQSVRQLERTLQVPLLQRTTRAVSPTEAGLKLVEVAAAPLKQAIDAMGAALTRPGEVTGSLRLLISQGAIPWVLEPVVPVLRRRYPRVQLEVVVGHTVTDFVAEGFDATFEVPEVIARDTVRLRLLPPFRFLVVGAPSYFAKHGTPKRPEDLLSHECLGFRWPAGTALYPWELQRGRRTWRVPVRGSLVSNSYEFMLRMAEKGLGLAYVAELSVGRQLDRGTLVTALESYAPTEEGLFLCTSSRTRRSPALEKFVEVTKEVLGL